MSFHTSVMGRGIVNDGAKKLSEVIKRIEQRDRLANTKIDATPEDWPPGVTMEQIISALHVDAEAVAFKDDKVQSWVTNCPHCDRIIGITLKGNEK